MDEKTLFYIVPTPIGNIKDITLRSIDILKAVDLILAEDTRTSGKLLKHYDITTPLKSYHIHNEHKILNSILSKLKGGERIALISDAGTPSISDPGYLLVRGCIDHDIMIECLPGATAFVPALINSGLPTDRFTFEGFLPHKKGRKSRLESLKDEHRTMIFYESPHRFFKAIEEFILYFGGDRKASVSRELTKMYEETINGTLDEIKIYYNEKKVKGEIVIVISGNKK